MKYCDYLVSLVEKDTNNKNIFNHLNSITKPLLEFIFKDSKKNSSCNETNNHLFLIEKIENKINRKFGFDF